MGKLYRAICGKYRKLEKPKILLSLRENLDYFFFFFAVSPGMKMKRYLKKKIRLRL